MDKLLQELGITQRGNQEGDKYIITLSNSDEYSQVYSKLDMSDKVTLDEYNTLVSDNVSELTYLSDEYDINLIANFTTDSYRVIITPAEENN